VASVRRLAPSPDPRSTTALVRGEERISELDDEGSSEEYVRRQ
jgi:hypothetical protein